MDDDVAPGSVNGDLRPDLPAGSHGDVQSVRDDLVALSNAKGHPTDNARLALARLDRAFAYGELECTPFLEQATADLRAALAAGEGTRLGGKSGEASRLILRAIVRAIG